MRYKPVQFTIPVTSPKQVNANLIDSEVENLLTKGAIAEINPIREGFFSRLFLVPKKGETFRPVIDLSFLNKFVENSHFQMENIHCLKSLLQKSDYLTTLDLKDAYRKRPCISRTFFQKIEAKNQGCGLSMDTSVFGVLKNLLNIHKTS